MITMTPSFAPADLLGLGGSDVRPAYGPGLCSGSADVVAVHIAAPTAPVQGTVLPAGSTAVRLRPVTAPVIGHDVTVDSSDNDTTFENNGTTLGIHSSRRPQS